MSLPTRAIVVSEDGTELDRQFVNCGWFATSHGIARTLMFDLVDNGYADTDIIKVYGIEVPINLLRNSADVEDLANKLTPIIDAYNAQPQKAS